MKEKILKIIDDNSCMSSCLRFLRIRDARENKLDIRTFYINNIKPDDYQTDEEPLEYTSNQIKTSKYTFWNFIPKNLFEQFRRVANFYFLINLIIIFIVPDPPTSPYANAIPIVFVVLVTAIKQAYEDILRHKSDNEINNTPVRILRDGKFQNFKWKNIKVGDIVEVLADQSFPCDLLLLHSNTENLMCHLTTANLDGETNLKKKSKPNDFPLLANEHDLSNFRGTIKCDKPNANLYEFSGTAVLNGKEYYIVNDNILLRGCNLKIAPFVYGLAIYTGKDTKMMKNSKFKSNKLSCIEKRLNIFIIVFLILLAVLTFSCFGGSYAYVDMYDSVWYLAGREPSFYRDNRTLFSFIVFIFYMNLFNYIIPLSLYVTMELQRFVGSQFLEWDIELYDPKTDQPAKANTSDLNEDLGQVEYLFSDKTGTLTENQMEFKQFSIEGTIYEEIKSKIYKLGSKETTDIFKNDQFVKLFQVLSLCHTVQVDFTCQEKYQASSPDEFSFVKFCAKIGLIYEGDEKDPESSLMIRKIIYKGQIFNYKILDVLEFDSDRKRMSVILRDMQKNQIILLCKGAETSILKNCVNGNIQSCDADIKTFAKQGWRTLALAYKYLTEQEYQEVNNSLKNAYNDIKNRKDRLAKAFNEIESRLNLIGATAVEDKLQDDVADTLEKLRRAGIKIWVLTGDKRETAINISHSCKHFSSNMIKLIMTDIKDEKQIEKRLLYFEKQLNPNDSYALIIDGGTLGILFKTSLTTQFRDICMKCDAVLCCRMTPAQKAEVVRLVKQSKEKPMTAAIGDGANDVSMIQEANVGLGIFGKEGRNAARSADFAFAKFKFARRILLVHGFLYYTRASSSVQYFFYKNLAFAICQFYYAFFNAFSVSSLYDSSILTLYNVVFTAAPILLYGLFEQKVSARKLEKTPFLYRTIKKNRYLRTFEFIKWNLLAVWHSVVSFFFIYAILVPSTALTSDGRMYGSATFGALVNTHIILVVHMKLLLEWQYKSFILLIGFSLSFLTYVIFCFVLNSFIIPYPITSLTDDQTIYWIYNNMFGTGPVWFNLALSMIVSLTPDIIIKLIENLRDKRLIHKEELEELRREKKASHIPNSEDNIIEDQNENIFTTPDELDGRRSASSSVSSKKKKKVRVFYVPTGLNRIYDTKVKEENVDKKEIEMTEKSPNDLTQRESMLNRSFSIHQRF